MPAFGSINISDAEMAAAGITGEPAVETPPAPAEPVVPAPAEPTPAAPAPETPAAPEQPATPAEPAAPPSSDPALAEAISALQSDIAALTAAVKPATPKGASAAEKMAALKAELVDMQGSEDERDKMLANLGLPLIEEFETLKATMTSVAQEAVQAERAQQADADRINTAYEQAFMHYGINPAEQIKVDDWVEKNVAVAAVLLPHETIARALGRDLVPAAPRPGGGAPRNGNGASPGGAPPADPNAAVIVGEPGRGGNPGRPTPTPDYGRTPISKVVEEQAARFGL